MDYVLFLQYDFSIEEKVLEWSESQREAQRAIEHAREEYLKQKQREEEEREEAAKQDILRREAAMKEAQQAAENTGNIFIYFDTLTLDRFN